MEHHRTFCPLSGLPSHLEGAADATPHERRAALQGEGVANADSVADAAAKAANNHPPAIIEQHGCVTLLRCRHSRDHRAPQRLPEPVRERGHFLRPLIRAEKCDVDMFRATTRTDFTQRALLALQQRFAQTAMLRTEGSADEAWDYWENARAKHVAQCQSRSDVHRPQLRQYQHEHIIKVGEVDQSVQHIVGERDG